VLWPEPGSRSEERVSRKAETAGGAVGVRKLRYGVDSAPDLIGADVLEVFAF